MNYPRVKWWALAIAMVAGTTVASTSAQAQQGTNLEEIIVTALKTETRIQDTPIALSVVSGDDLIESGITDVTDLPNIAPGVEIQKSSFGPVLSIRGVTTTDNTSKGDQGIAYNIDGVNVGRPREQAFSFFDIDRVEVLRGPQGTLYGKSSTGGVLNILTNRPEHEFAASADLEFSNYNTRRTTAVVNTPVTDNLAIRLAANQNVRDGYLYTSLGDADYALNSADRNDENSRGFRLSALWDISTDSTLFVTATKGRQRGTGAGGVPFGNFQAQGGDVSLQGFANPFEPRRDDDFKNLTLEFTTTLGGIDLTYIGGIREYAINTIDSSTHDPALNGNYDWIHYQGTGDTTSHELRINGGDEALNWVAGLNWFQEELWESDHRWFVPFGVEPTLANSLNDIDPLNNTDHESSGVFGQMNWLVSDRLNLVLGLRYSDDEVVRVGTFAPGPGPWPNPEGGTCVAPDHCVGGPNLGNQSDSKLTYRVGLDYNLDSGMAYASIATGYKAGGFNDFGPSGGTESYAPETMTAYEIGYKGNITENLQYNTAVYYYDYEEAQIQSFTFEFGVPVLYTYIAPVKMKGWENELVWTPTDTDRVDFELRFADSEYVDFDSAGTGIPGSPGVSWDGLAIDRVPATAGSIAYSHDWNLDNGGFLTARIRSRYSSGYVLSDIAHDYRYWQDSYTRTDFNLTYHSPDDRFSFGLFVRNLEDEVQLTGLPEAPVPGAENGIEVGISEPMTYGMTFGLEY